MITANDQQRPITLLICALGGEGGGVLVEWLVSTARACGFAAQSTSIPGVAQRTGSTTYYIEVYPVPLGELKGKQPVFSLYPVAGALDALVSSELLETVRQVGNGMVSPDRTRVVTSTSRTLTTAEKMQPGDGRASMADLLDMVAKFSQRCESFDMSELARETGTVVSAVLLGAIAGSELFPFPRNAFEKTIQRSGRGVEASLEGFARAFERIRDGAGSVSAASNDNGLNGADSDRASLDRIGSDHTAESGGSSGSEMAAGNAVRLPDLPVHARDIFPQSTQDIISLGYARMLEYQDHAYAQLYLARLAQVLEVERVSDSDEKHDFAVTKETARYLALWMAFDDIVRVADLKCRASRFARVRSEVKAEQDEVVHIHDFFKPGVPEFAGLLPDRVAQSLLRWDRRRRSAGKSPFAMPLKVGAHTVFGFLALRGLASLRWLRKLGSRFSLEQAMIDRWLDGVRRGVISGWNVGHEIALCGRLIKGYGTTNERGKENLLHVLDHLATAEFDSEHARANAISSARAAALEDDTGKALDKTLASHGASPRPIKAQPVVWMKKPRQTVS